MKTHSILIKGVTTGFILQLAIGPVFLFVFNLALQHGFGPALAAVAGITLADYFYITLSLAGAGQALQKPGLRSLFTLASTAVLTLFGLALVAQAFSAIAQPSVTLTAASLTGMFLTGLILTLSSPLTIVFWTGIFTARSMQYKFNQKQQIIFGLSAGLPTFFVLGSMALSASLFHWYIPTLAIRLLNGLVGLLLIGFGIIRSVSEFAKKNRPGLP